jgi:hypothetical protein
LGPARDIHLHLTCTQIKQHCVCQNGAAAKPDAAGTILSTVLQLLYVSSAASAANGAVAAGDALVVLLAGAVV